MGRHPPESPPDPNRIGYTWARNTKHTQLKMMIKKKTACGSDLYNLLKTNKQFDGDL